MSRGVKLLAILCACMVVCVGIASLAVGARRYLTRRKIGYCFDAALDPKTDRLYVAGGAAGLHVLSDSRGRLLYRSTHPGAGYCRNLRLSDGRAYTADTERGLVVLDVTGSSPLITWQQGDVMGMGIDLEGDRAYLASGEDGLYIFDVARPDRPAFLSQTETAGSAWDVWVDNGYAYVADVDQGLTVIDVAAPTAPALVGFVTWDDESPLAEIVRGEGDAVFIAAARHGLVAVDIADGDDPVLASIYRLATDSWAEGLAVKESIVYLAVGNKRDSRENGLHILDASDPYRISPIAKLAFPGWVEGVYVTADVAYIANTWSGIRSVDIRRPADARLVDSFGLGDWVAQRLRSTFDLRWPYGG
ncbi:MAG: hypothetical protein PVH41_12585 [Anaerolineae bacterium]